MVDKINLKYTQYIIVNSDVKKMQDGKRGAQIGHAAVGGFRRYNMFKPEIAEAWFFEGQRKIALKASQIEIERINYEVLHNTDAYTYVVEDFGLTQIPADTLTCMSIGPDLEEKIKPFVKDLKLL